MAVHMSARPSPAMLRNFSQACGQVTGGQGGRSARRANHEGTAKREQRGREDRRRDASLRPERNIKATAASEPMRAPKRLARATSPMRLSPCIRAIWPVLKAVSSKCRAQQRDDRRVLGRSGHEAADLVAKGDRQSPSKEPGRQADAPQQVKGSGDLLAIFRDVRPRDLPHGAGAHAEIRYGANERDGRSCKCRKYRPRRARRAARSP